MAEGAASPDVAVVVLSTAPSTEVADALSDAILTEGLAACVSQLPGVTSRYRWQGAMEEAQEIVLLIKTHADRAPALTRRLAELHPYDVPEILVLPAAAGLGAYLDWVRAETRGPLENG